MSQPCRFCGKPVPDERVAIGYTHCMSRECVAAWRRERIEEKHLVLQLMPKQGLAWTAVEDLGSGRASGR